jgi:hypothetical protein
MHLLEGEIPMMDPVIRVFQNDGRLWIEHRSPEVFGGEKKRSLLQPVSETVLRAVGPLSDMGPIVKIEDGNVPRLHFAGWTFERVAE